MRCQQCGQSNPEKNKFCGMCGSKFEPVVIDDGDPLGLEAPAYWSGDPARSTSQVPAELREQDRHRELVRDSVARSSSVGRGPGVSSTAAVDFPPSTVEEETHELPHRREPAARAIRGIAGPSFLGLGDEGATDSGFVYDKPRNNGFIYDTDADTPEYLLEEVPRGISWRAWALFALLLVGAGLGYVQWRASNNQGPDISAILSGNGATVDPGGPVMTGNNAKSAPKKPELSKAEASKTNSADGDAEGASAEGATAASKNANDVTESNTASTKAAKKDESADSNAEDDPEKASAPASKGADELAKPESDGPTSKLEKSRQAKLAPEEAKAAPKPLGDKDPLIVEAERYIQGRGVRQNCSTGINLLHQAMSAGNPAADVKMGALYWSGTCVTQSNLTAYQWFSRAHALEPQNRWIERSRNSLWASMSSDEKRRVSY